jgi:hypothetical protein
MALFLMMFDVEFVNSRKRKCRSRICTTPQVLCPHSIGTSPCGDGEEVGGCLRVWENLDLGLAGFIFSIWSCTP